MSPKTRGPALGDGAGGEPLPASTSLVLDSTVLINLAKAGLLERLRGLPERLLVPWEVHQETAVEGMRQGRPEGRSIADAAEEGILVLLPKASAPALKEVSERHRLRGADAAVIAQAMRCRGVACSDDAKVRKVASVEGVRCRGTGYLLARLLKTGILTKEEAREYLDRMIGRGWWVTVETYARLLAELGI